MIGIFFFVFGAIIGSFLNVLVLRLKTGEGIGGRSHCMSCGHTLTTFELIPILSFFAQRCRCLICKTKISWQYPLVEILTGLSFLLIYLHFSEGRFLWDIRTSLSLVFALFSSALLIAILVYDMRHKIIEPRLVLVLIGLSALSAALRFYDHFFGIFTLPLILDFFAGPLFYLFFYALWRVSDGRWIGLGDANLGLAIGFFLGFWPGLSALILAFWVGAVVGLFLIFFSRMHTDFLRCVLPVLSLKTRNLAVTMKSEVPFAPFLIIGLAGVYLFNINVFSFF